MPCHGYPAGNMDFINQLIVSAISLQVGRSGAELHKLQLDDPTIKLVLLAKCSGDKPTSDSLKQYSQHTNRLFAL